MNTGYKYQLAKIVTTCPNCGAKRFKPYIDTVTGQLLPRKYGRCNREHICAYWLDPYKDGFGRLSPDDWKAKQVGQAGGYALQSPQKPQQPPQTKPSFIDDTTFNKSLAGYDNNTLIKELCRIVGQEKTMQAVRRYCVGTAKSGATVFWQLDTGNKVRTGKVIHYKPDGHRNHDVNINWAHKALKLPDFNLTQCLFGEHLLSGNNKHVVIVESEKTAIIGSARLPNFVWLACGGCGSLSAKLCEPLRGRKVLLCPDAGKYNEWKEKATALSTICDISVSDWIEQRATEGERKAGLDLVDYLLRELPPKEIAAPQPATPTETPEVERLQPEAIKSIPGQETPAEVKETAQNRIAECLPKTHGVCYGQTFAPVWEDEIKELEAFFDSRKEFARQRKSARWRNSQCAVIP